MLTNVSMLYPLQNDCGEATYTRSDGTTLLLNCAGPRHTYFRWVGGERQAVGGG